MRYQNSAIARAAIAIREFWRDGVYLQEKLLELPGADQGELAWRRSADGPRLVGRGLALNDEQGSTLDDVEEAA